MRVVIWKLKINTATQDRRTDRGRQGTLDRMVGRSVMITRRPNNLAASASNNLALAHQRRCTRYCYVVHTECLSPHTAHIDTHKRALLLIHISEVFMAHQLLCRAHTLTHQKYSAPSVMCLCLNGACTCDDDVNNDEALVCVLASEWRWGASATGTGPALASAISAAASATATLVIITLFDYTRRDRSIALSTHTHTL